MKQRLSAKITTLLQQVPVVRNLARQRFVGQVIIALLKSRNVQFYEVAQHLNDANEKVKPIARKNHGYRATSLSRHGLHILRQLNRPHTPPHEPLARKIIALLDWFIRHLAYCQLPKIVG